MADVNDIASALLTPNYINPAYATPEQRAQLYSYGNELMKPQPINNGWQGLASIARALIGGYESHIADTQEQASRANAQAETTPTGGAGNIPVAPGSAVPQIAATGAPQASSAAPNAANGAPDPVTALKANIANVESSGGNYGAVGPTTKTGDRAYGKYQVMGANVPSWTQEVLGKPMTPQEFLANPQAQEAIASTKLGQYLHETGSPQDAASMWFTGKPLAQGANRADQNGMTGARYAQLATRAMPPQAAGAGAPGSPAYNGPQLGAMIADPNLPPEIRKIAIGLSQPHTETDTTGRVVPIYQGAVSEPSAASLGARVPIGVGADGSVHTEGIVSGSPANPSVSLPGLGPTGSPGSSSPLGPIGDLSSAAAAQGAHNANVAAKQTAATARYQAAQEAGPQLMAASYPLRQLQAIIARNGGNLPSGEGSEQLMKGLSVANMLGTLIGHPIASEDSNLPTLELLKKYGMQAAQAQAQSLGLHTNLGLESAEITSPNPALSGPANAHLVDNLVRLNQVAQKKAQFEHDLFLKNGQSPDAYDNATTQWQAATSGANAIPLASAKFGHQYTNAKGEKRVIVPSTDPSGFSIYSPEDPAVADIGPQAK